MRASIKLRIEPLSSEDGGGFLATVPALPGCMSDGETVGQAIKNGIEAAHDWVGRDYSRVEVLEQLARDLTLEVDRLRRKVREMALSELARLDGETLP